MLQRILFTPRKYGQPEAQAGYRQAIKIRHDAVTAAINKKNTTYSTFRDTIAVIVRDFAKALDDPGFAGYKTLFFGPLTLEYTNSLKTLERELLAFEFNTLDGRRHYVYDDKRLHDLVKSFLKNIRRPSWNTYREFIDQLDAAVSIKSVKYPGRLATFYTPEIQEHIKEMNKANDTMDQALTSIQKCAVVESKYGAFLDKTNEQEEAYRNVITQFQIALQKAEAKIGLLEKLAADREVECDVKSKYIGTLEGTLSQYWNAMATVSQLGSNAPNNNLPDINQSAQIAALMKQLEAEKKQKEYLASLLAAKFTTPPSSPRTSRTPRTPEKPSSRSTLSTPASPAKSSMSLQ